MLIFSVFIAFSVFFLDILVQTRFSLALYFTIIFITGHLLLNNLNSSIKKIFFYCFLIVNFTLFIYAFFTLKLHNNLLNLLNNKATANFYNYKIKNEILKKFNDGNILILFDNLNLFFPNNCISPDVYAKKFINEITFNKSLQKKYNLKYFYFDLYFFEKYNSQYKIFDNNKVNLLFDMFKKNYVVFYENNVIILKIGD